MARTPKFSIYIPVYKTEQFLDNVFSCIDKQDYKNIEKIVVVNKNNKEVIKKSEKWGATVVTIDEDRGAPYARNRGLEATTGEYILSMDSDTYLFPGALTCWANGFKKYEEADFVYTEFEIIDTKARQTIIYPGQKFNKYHLACENYINTATPIRRRALVTWDEDLKSLQDWDYFWKIVDNGGTGKLLGRFLLYQTEAPRADGISVDGSNNMFERRKIVREKHGVFNRDTCITTDDYQEEAIVIAEEMGADFRASVNHRNASEYKVIYKLVTNKELINVTTKYV